MAYEQPPRADCDGPMGTCRLPAGFIAINVMHNGVEQRLVCSEYNAGRLFASLAIVLGIRINATDAKAIKL